MGTIIAMLVLLPVLGHAWHSWKHTMRDYVRDQLFILRDEWRDHWVENGLDMKNPAYANVRDYINCCLRYTKHFRLVELFYYAHHKARVRTADDDARFFKTGRRDLDALAQTLRHRAIRQIQLYMVTTSLIMLPASVFAFFEIIVVQFRRPFSSAKKSVGKTVDWLSATNRKTIEKAVLATA